MEPTTLIASLQDAAPGAEFESVPSVDLHTTIYAPRDQIAAIARALRDGADLRFDFLAELTATDFWPREPRFEVVYMLVSTALRHRARIKVRLQKQGHVVLALDGLQPDVGHEVLWVVRDCLSRSDPACPPIARASRRAI